MLSKSNMAVIRKSKVDYEIFSHLVDVKYFGKFIPHNIKVSNFTFHLKMRKL